MKKRIWFVLFILGITPFARSCTVTAGFPFPVASDIEIAGSIRLFSNFLFLLLANFAILSVVAYGLLKWRQSIRWLGSFYNALLINLSAQWSLWLLLVGFNDTNPPPPLNWLAVAVFYYTCKIPELIAGKFQSFMNDNLADDILYRAWFVIITIALTVIIYRVKGRIMKTFIFLLMVCAAVVGPAFAGVQKVPIPAGDKGVAFDDLAYSVKLHKVIVPSDGTGELNLVDPDTLTVTSIPGFSREKGITSADEGNGWIFTADRGKKVVVIVDPAAKKIIGSAPLAGGADYVRYVGMPREVWVTDPPKAQIEVFSLSADGKPVLAHSAVISVPGGPESLVIDGTRKRAYTNLLAGMTVAIDIKTHTVVAQWANGCKSSRGLALDEKRGLLFVAGEEGKVVALDLNHDGKILSSVEYGSGADIISYSPARMHVYLPAGKSASMAVIGVTPKGELTVLGMAGTAARSCSAVADDVGNVWVADPAGGRLLGFKDQF